MQQAINLINGGLKLKKIGIVLLIALTLTACGKKVNYSELNYKEGLYYNGDEKKPFSGKTYGYYDNGKIMEELDY